MRDALSGELLTAKHSNWVNWFQCESKLRGLKGMGECTARIAMELSRTNTRGKPNCAQKSVKSRHQARRNRRLIGCFHSFATTRTRTKMSTAELNSFIITRIGPLIKWRKASAAWYMLHMYGQSWKVCIRIIILHPNATRENTHSNFITLNTKTHLAVVRSIANRKPDNAFGSGNTNALWNAELLARVPLSPLLWAMRPGSIEPALFQDIFDEQESDPQKMPMHLLVSGTEGTLR